jgi:hypothetical protein
MTRPIRASFLPLGALLCAGLSFALPSRAHCVLDDDPRESLDRWKASGFALDDAAARDARALDLAACLGDPDPALRDGIAYAALSAWMRGKRLDVDALRALQRRLLAQLDGDDAEGFRKPFSALALSEVARTDRIAPWMTPGERARMAAAAAAYLRSVADYRGYVDGEGWRHGVAHGADWALQLVLDDALEPSQVWPLLSAVAAQVMPADGHAYAFDEPARLARPAAYAAARGDLDAAALDAWLHALVSALGPPPDGERQRAWWIRRANLQNFLRSLYCLVDQGDAPAPPAFRASVRAALRELP